MPTEEAQKKFSEGMADIIGDGRVVAQVGTDPARTKLDQIANNLRTALDDLSRACTALVRLRKDRTALPGLVSDAAILRREIEAKVNQLMQDYVDEAMRRDEAST